jgi:hypothetical protein
VWRAARPVHDGHAQIAGVVVLDRLAVALQRPLIIALQRSGVNQNCITQRDLFDQNLVYNRVACVFVDQWHIGRLQVRFSCNSEMFQWRALLCTSLRAHLRAQSLSRPLKSQKEG